MELIIAQLSGYVIVILFALYTFYAFFVFLKKTQQGKDSVFRAQRILIFLLHLLCSGVLLLEQKSVDYILLWGLELLFYVVFTKVYQKAYKGLSKLVFNNMMACMMIGFVILGRLEEEYAYRQLFLAAVAMGICLLVPLFIERFTIWEKIGWQYGIVGILFLLLVFVIGVEKYGARNWISIAGVAIQPSEFVKIIYVFFVASLLSKTTRFKHIVMITVMAAIHVVILVVERDLGAALIYFVAYLMMLYVATMKVRYLLAGIGGGTAASIVAYELFSHVRIRVLAWKDPWSHINNEGYQICQSLFAIGTGGLFGMGLGQGLPSSVPVVESDFVFSAISEELGTIFSICLILVYLSSFIMFINIALKMKKRFYKLSAFGLSVVFIFQVFLCIGGASKFIPSTGVTLPLISYGGSSVMTTIIIFSIIQGMYVMNGREAVNIDEEKDESTLATRRGRKSK